MSDAIAMPFEHDGRACFFRKNISFGTGCHAQKLAGVGSEDTGSATQPDRGGLQGIRIKYEWNLGGSHQAVDECQCSFSRPMPGPISSALARLRRC